MRRTQSREASVVARAESGELRYKIVTLLLLGQVFDLRPAIDLRPACVL